MDYFYTQHNIIAYAVISGNSI